MRKDHGLRQFSVYQGNWNAGIRDFEREIIPTCKSEGIGLAPWGALGGGNFTSEEQRKTAKEGRQSVSPSAESDIKVSKALEKVANAKGTLITSVALAYVMHKAPYVFPIVGGRKVSHLKGNIEALGIELSDEEMAEIENAIDFQYGFPNEWLVGHNAAPQGPGDICWTNFSGSYDYVEEGKVRCQLVKRMSLTLMYLFSPSSRKSNNNEVTH